MPTWFPTSIIRQNDAEDFGREASGLVDELGTRIGDAQKELQQHARSVLPSLESLTPWTQGREPNGQQPGTGTDGGAADPGSGPVDLAGYAAREVTPIRDDYARPSSALPSLETLTPWAQQTPIAPGSTSAGTVGAAGAFAPPSQDTTRPDQYNADQAAPVQRGGDLRAYARQAAERNGVDPNIFERQINQESGFNPTAGSPAGAQGIAQIVPQYHPGVDTSDPYASLDYAAQLMGQHLKTYGGDYRKALQAYNAGPGAVASGAADTYEETNRYTANILQGQQPAQTVRRPESTPASAQSASVDQAALDDPDKWSLCGPVAAVLAATKRGGDWSVAQAKQLASSLGLWNPSQGMAGLGSEVQLLNKLGISATTGAADQQRLATEADNGNTPIVSTDGHYFVLQGYDPSTGKFDTGNTGTVYRGGSRWLSLDDMQRLAGTIQGAAYIDNPASPTPSTATGPSRAEAAQADLSRGGVGTQALERSGADTSDQGNPDQPSGLSRRPLASDTPTFPTPLYQDEPESDVYRPRAIDQTDQGNINLNARPVVQNGDGSISTVRSMSFEDDDGKEVLIPTVSPGGRILSNAEAIDLYRRTGQHLGKFATPAAADAYAEQLHQQQAEQYGARPLQLEGPDQPSGLTRTPIRSETPTFPTPPSPLYADQPEGDVYTPRASDNPAPTGQPGIVETFAPGGILSQGLRAVAGVDQTEQDRRRWREIIQFASDNGYRGAADPNFERDYPELAKESNDLTFNIVANTAAPGPEHVPGLPGLGGRPPIYGPRGETLRPPTPLERPAVTRSRILNERGEPITLNTEQEVSRLRLDKFPEEIREDLRAAAGNVNFGREQRRGVIPDAVANELADTYSQSAEHWIRQARQGRSYNEEETLALRNVTASTALKVHELTVEINSARAAGTTPDLLIAQRAAESNRLNGLVATAEGARAEAGRSFRAWRMDTRLLADDPQAAIQRIYQKIGNRAEADKIAAEYSQAITDGADPIGMAKIWAKVERGEIKTGERFALYRRFNMLSGPRTWEVNTVSGLVNLAYEDLAASATSVARGDLRGAAVQFSAPWLGLGRAARGFTQTLAHGITEEQALRGDIPRSLSARATNPLDRAQLLVQEFPDRLNAAVDQFWRGTGESLGLATHAVDTTRGFKGEARTQAIAQIMAEPDEAAANAAKRIGDAITFQGELGAFGRGLQAVQKVPYVGNLMIPFLRTVYNITTRSIDLSPLGVATTAQELVRSAPGISRIGHGAYTAGKPLPAGVPELSRRVRDNLVGTLIFAWAYDQAQQGNITAAGPDDPQKRDELRATGWRPYSIKIGDAYHSYANIAPVSLALSMGASAQEAQKYAKTGAGTGDLMADGLRRTVSVVSDMSVVAGIGAVVKAQQDPERYGVGWITQYLQTFVPAGSALNTIGQATDPLERRSMTGSDTGTKITEGLKARVPGLREEVPAAADVLGRPIANQQTGFGALYPTRPSVQRDEPVLHAFLDAKVDINRPSDAMTVDGVKISLTPAEQRRYLELRGQLIQRFAPRVINSAGYQRGGPQAKEAALNGLLDDVLAAARDQMIGTIGGAEVTRRVREGAKRAS